ncbi:MAG: VOC family protein [Planctomycetota bacterium]|nr:VOC family protein [Planctomycetota bacterium]MDA1027251.1 VOC family protein [Planctomycetota bacterium]
MTLPPFHLAFPVRDLESSRRFYGELLGCTEGRSSDRWIDFDFYGHQIVAHMVDGLESAAADANADSNAVDGHDVPVPHFGLVLPWAIWHELADRLRAAGTTFVIEPYLRFEGLPGEQATMFLLDPSQNALEFKAFKDPTQLFAT